MKKNLFCVVCLALCGATLSAATKYWDTNGATAGAGGATPAGNWDISTPNWSTNAFGTNATTTFVAGDLAVFSAGTDATGTFVVTVPSAITVGGITIEEGTVQKASGGGAITVGTGSITINPGAKFSIDGSLAISASAGAVLNLNGSTMENRTTGAAGSFISASMTISVGPNGGILSFPTTNVQNIVQTGTPGTTISGAGGITKVGVGVLAIATACNYLGTTTINEGELRIRTTADRLPTSTDVIVNPLGILNLNGVNQQIGSLTGSGNVGFGAGILTLGGTSNTVFSGALMNITNAGATAVTTGSGKLVRTGTGTITFAGTNDISGPITLTSGGINVSPLAVLCGPNCDLVINGGTLNLSNASQTIENLSGTGGTVNLAAGHTLTVAALSTTTYGGTIAGAGNLIKTNVGTVPIPWTLSGANTYTGTTVVSGGSLLVNGSLGTNTVTVTGATLGGSGTIAGPVTIQPGATLAPGSPIGVLTLSRSPALQGTTIMDVNRTSIPNSDRLVVSQPLTYGGTLTVNRTGNPLVDGDTFNLFSAPSISGTFAATNLPAVGAGTNWFTPDNFATLIFNVWPTIQNTNFTRAAGLGLKIKFSDLLNSVGGKTVSAQSLGAGSQGATITSDSTSIRYVPANDNNDSFTFTVNDGRGGTVSGTINVIVLKAAGAATSVNVADGAATISCAGIPGYAYLLQRSTNIVDWVTILNTNAPPLGLFSFTDTFSDLGTPPPSAYYRVAQP